MVFTKVETIPTRKGRTNLKQEFEDFMATRFKMAKVTLENGHYSNSKVAYTTLSASAKRYGFPIKVVNRGDDIYLIRTDM